MTKRVWQTLVAAIFALVFTTAIAAAEVTQHPPQAQQAAAILTPGHSPVVLGDELGDETFNTTTAAGGIPLQVASPVAENGDECNSQDQASDLPDGVYTEAQQKAFETAFRDVTPATGFKETFAAVFEVEPIATGATGVLRRPGGF